MANNKRWTPRSLPGGVYCSPGCGAGCKKSAFNEATRKATALAKSLGGGFVPYVWENMGWYWSARQVDRGRTRRLIAEVSPSVARKFYRADLYVGGHSFTGRNRAPDRALGDAVAKARSAATAITKDLAKV